MPTVEMEVDTFSHYRTGDQHFRVKRGVKRKHNPLSFLICRVSISQSDIRQKMTSVALGCGASIIIQCITSTTGTRVDAL